MFFAAAAPSFQQVLNDFAHDTKLAVVVALIALDILFGSLAALRMKKFAWSYLGAFLKTDVLFKMVPWFALYAVSKYVPSNDAVGGIVSFGTLADSALVAVVGAILASIVSSAAEIGLTGLQLKPDVAGVTDARTIAAGGGTVQKAGQMSRVMATPYLGAIVRTIVRPENPAQAAAAVTDDLAPAAAHPEPVEVHLPANGNRDILLTHRPVEPAAKVEK